MTELKNPVEFHTFCKQAQITPMRYRHLVNLGKVPPVVAGQVDFVLAIMSLYKIFRVGGQYLEDICPDWTTITSAWYGQLKKEGKVPEPVGGMVEISEVMPALLKQFKRSYEGGGGQSLVDEQKRRTRIQADRQELLYFREKGELIIAKEAMKQWSGTVMAAKVRINAMSRKLAPLIFGGESIAEVQEIIQREVDAICNELAEPDLKAIARKDGTARQSHKRRMAPIKDKAKTDGKPVGRPRKSIKPGGNGRTRKVVHGKS